MPRPQRPQTVEASRLWPTRREHDAAKLDRRDRACLASSLGLPNLNAEHVDLIEFALAVYRLQKKGHRTTTVGSTLAEIKELIKAIERAIKTGTPRAQSKAQKIMERIRDGNSGLASEARERLLTCSEIPENVLSEARTLAAYYERHPRIESEAEPFRHFCGILSCIFDGIAAPDAEDTRHRERRRRRFAMAVFDLVGIERLDFENHPARLDELLATPVPLVPPELTASGSVPGEFVPSMAGLRGPGRA